MGKDFEVVQGGKPKTEGLKEASKRVRQGRENHLAHRTSLDWRLAKAIVCKARDEKADLVYTDVVMDVVRQSRTANTLLDDAAMQNLDVIFDKQTKISQVYAKGDTLIIAVNPNRPKGELINTIAKEIRHAWQVAKGNLVNPMDYEPDQALLINRAQNADETAATVKAVWELNLAGEADAWDYMTVSSIGGIAREYEKTARADFRTINNGLAARKIYNALFTGIHTKNADKRIIHQMLLDDVGYMKQGGKKAYVAIDTFTKMGEMPFSANYMLADKATLPNDPSFCKVEDRGNANFIWFIKFERQYQEKELEITAKAAETAQVIDFASFRKEHDALLQSKPA